MTAYCTLKRRTTHLATCTRRQKSISGSFSRYLVDFGAFCKVDFLSKSLNLVNEYNRVEACRLY